MKFYNVFKKHENNIKLLLVFVVFLFCIYFLKTLLQKNTEESTIETTIDEKYKNLIDNFEKIFPDSNRNAGGPQLFNWINNNFKDSKDFVDYCQLYCPISGSPIDPKNKDNFSVIEIKNVFDSNKTKGKMFRCCWPCLCDAIKYVKCDKFTRKDGHHYMVLVINDPCHFESNIPKEVTSYQCDANNKTSNGVYSDNGKLIIGLLHSVSKKDTPTNIPNECFIRNSKEPDSLQNGMGDIFVKLTQVDKQIPNPTLNVYNEELKSCPDNSDSKIGGSWDENQKCSEIDGGVHQICYRDIGLKADKFSKNTGQSDWSTDRGTNNHCVCLGAWSLYESKTRNNDKQSNIAPPEKSRVKCEAIPNITLTNNYVKNFSSWNGLERDGQIKDGVEGLVKECIKDAKDDKEKINHLINNYCKFADSVDHTKVPIKYDIKSGNLNDFYDKFCN